MTHKIQKAQAAMEFITTYGWAILIIMVVLGFIYYLLSSQSNITPTICNINSNFKCTEVLIESNSLSSYLLFFLNNNQQYPLMGTTITANISSIGILTAKCLPTFVLPGGDLICSTTTSQTFSNSLSLGGKININSTACTNLTNPTNCNNGNPINYSGTIDTKVIPYSPNKCSISLTSPFSSLIHNTRYPINATVKMNGFPIAGATVNFTTTSGNLAITPTYVNTASNGNATTYITSNAATTATLKAVFYTCQNTLSLTFS